MFDLVIFDLLTLLLECIINVVFGEHSWTIRVKLSKYSLDSLWSNNRLYVNGGSYELTVGNFLIVFRDLFDNVIDFLVSHLDRSFIHNWFQFFSRDVTSSINVDLFKELG